MGSAWTLGLSTRNDTVEKPPDDSATSPETPEETRPSPGKVGITDSSRKKNTILAAAMGVFSVIWMPALSLMAVKCMDKIWPRKLQPEPEPPTDPDTRDPPPDKTSKESEEDPTKPETSEPEKRLSTGTVVVITIMGMVLLILVSLVLYYILWRKSSTQKDLNQYPELEIAKQDQSFEGTPPLPNVIPNPDLCITSIDDMNWDILRSLGHGAYGKVDLAVRRTDGAMFAVKTVHSGAAEKHIKNLVSEIKTLSMLSHDNIVKYCGAMNTTEGFFLYMEYVTGGSLHSCIQDLGTIPPNLARIYTKQMLEGLEFMHKHSVVHRDLKPANVLISVDGKVKLADFGTAFDLSKVTHTLQQTLVGTPAFVAPEVIRKGAHSTKTDIWSLGVTVYNMMTGKLPFRARDKYTLLLELANQEVELEFPKNFPSVFRE